MGYIGNQPFLGTVTGDVVVDGTVGTADLTDGAVTAAKLATTAILDKLGYTPVSTAGTGATGTWGISISGNAATATTATNVSGGTANVTTLSASGNVTLSGGTANGVLYLNGSNVASSGSALTFDGNNAVISVNSSSDALRITQIGAGNALLVEDSANPDASPTAITATGAVGIGTASPSTVLHVKGTSGGTDPTVLTGERVRIQSNDITSRSTYLSLIAGTAANSGVFFGDQDSADVGRILYLHSDNSMQFYTSGSERMRLLSGGGLHLGTVSNATGIATQFLSKSSANYAASAVFESDGSAANWARTDWKNANVATSGIIYVDQSGLFAIRNDGNLPMAFYTNGPNERLRITAAGDVGIGKTPAAGRLLDVNADSWFNGVRVGRGSLSNNTIVGSNALISTTTGDFNVAIGFEAGNANTTGYQNTFVGYRAGLTNTTAIFNTGIGCNALQAATTGAGNTAVGNQCLQLTTTGGNNSAVGVYALYANTTGSLNTAIGYAASMGQTTALYNVAVGAYSLHYTTTGSANTSTGYYSLLNCTTGGNNTSIGYYSGTGITTGSHNVLIGQQAGYHSVGIITGVANICVGNYADVQASSDNYSIVIGYLAQGKGTSTGFIAPYNGGSMYQGNNSSSWATTSDRRIKKNIVDCTLGLEKINQIRVCNFEYRTKDEIDPSIPQSSAVPKAGVQLGVIAQEIQQIIPESVKEESTGVLSVDTDRVIWHLVNAVKELSAQVDALKARIGE